MLLLSLCLLLPLISPTNSQHDHHHHDHHHHGSRPVRHIDSPPETNTADAKPKKTLNVGDAAMRPMYELQETLPLESGRRRGRLQGVSVKGRLLCGTKPMSGARVKIVDVDKRPDKDDLMGDVRTGDNGSFHISGATREEGQIEVLMKIYHDCMDEDKPCQRKVMWRIPPAYYNNGTFVEWFDIGTVNMELIFENEERDCRH